MRIKNFQPAPSADLPTPMEYEALRDRLNAVRQLIGQSTVELGSWGGYTYQADGSEDCVYRQLAGGRLSYYASLAGWISSGYRRAGFTSDGFKA